MKNYQIIVIGAGAAGIGFASALKRFKIEDFIVLEQGEVGDSFLKWPATTQFISPSFTTNGFGFPDLNAIFPDTSPAYTFAKQHLSGSEYAEYLKLVSKVYELPVKEKTTVESIKKNDDGYYQLSTNQGDFKTKYIIMATGEFKNPFKSGIKGAEYGIHYGEAKTFDMKSENPFVVLGGNESACDILVKLASKGNKVSLYTQNFGKSETAPDPSIALSPVTREALRELGDEEKYDVNIYENKKAKKIEKINDEYIVHFDDGTKISTKNNPILATGFRTCVHKIVGIPLFDYNKDGIPLVTGEDESTKATNIFLIGPSLRQQKIIFCYIYKFRQRFVPIIAEIAKREGMALAESDLDFFKKNNMFLTDLSCCSVECADC